MTWENLWNTILHRSYRKKEVKTKRKKGNEKRKSLKKMDTLGP